MGLINLTVHPRAETGKNSNRRLRESGRTPAVIYGAGRKEALNAEVDTHEFRKALSGFSGQFPIFTLNHADGSPATVAVLREMQRHPVSDMVYHCDLFEIPENKEIEMEVGLEFVGENKVIRGGDGVLEVVQRSISVLTLPADLPDTIDVDISELELNDKITAGDLGLGTVKVLTPDDEILAKINPNTLVAIEDEVEEAEGEEAEGEEAAEESEEEESSD